MDEDTKGEATHRLEDIRPREVSLVDRAANKRRYLIVKRSDEGMSDGTSAADDQSTDMDLSSGGQDGAADAHGDGDVGGTQGGDTLDVAVQALGGLTDAVEELSSLAGDALRERATEVAGDLQAAAELLLDHTGLSPQGDAASSGEDNGSTESADDDDSGDIFSGIRTAIDRVTSMLATQDEEVQKAKAKKPKPDDDDEDQEAEKNAGPDLAARLGELAKQIATLAGEVKKQGGRLSTLEKRTGVPQSKPAGERAQTNKSSQDESWPFDLNAPYDRDSVDKDSSFYGV